MSKQTRNSIWQNKIFVKMFGSYSISMLGRWFDMVAIIVLFGFVWDASPLVISMIPIAYALPHALLSQFAGILTDRLNKIKLMIAADLMTAGFSLMLFFAATPAVALTIIFARATLTVVHFPAQQSMIKHVVEDKLITKAVTLNGTVNEFTKIVGPLLGGSLAAAFSPKLCILITAITYFLSALLLLTIKNKEAGKHNNMSIEGESVSFWDSWKAGWSAVLNNRALFFSIAFALIGLAAIQMVDIQIAVLLREIAPERPELVGWLMASSGGGAVITMLVMGRVNEIRSYGMLLGTSFLLMGCGFMWVGFLSVGFPNLLAISLGFLIGIGVGFLTIGISYMLQKETTKDSIGRVSGIYNSLSNTIMLIAPLLGGILVGFIEVRMVYVFVGVALLILGVIGMVVKRFFSEKMKNTSEVEFL